MRLYKLSVKSFKSINKFENLDINDLKISTIIGKNGSGKSNILLAINTLKQTKKLIDSDRYEKKNRDEEIFIQAFFKIDESDDNLFEKASIKKKDLTGFVVTISKKKGELVQSTFTPDNFSKDTSKEAIEKIKPTVNKILKNTSIDESQKIKIKDHWDAIREKIKNKKDIGSDPTLLAPVEAIEKIVTPFEGAGEFLNFFKEALELIKFDVLSFIEKEIWPKLNINMLSLGEYPIETKVLISEINNGEHPFIMDLLDLSESKIEDFKLSGEDLNNNKNDASKVLTKQLKNVWKSHDLEFVIDVQGDYFSVFFITPQKRRRKLEDLSDGQKWFLRFYTKLAIAKKKKEQVVWLFDEPGQAMHASAQQNLREYFEEISKYSQIFYTTHQPMMIPWHRLERILVAENNPKYGTIISHKLWKDEEVISPLREALGLFVGESLFTGKEHIIVEGPSDYIYLMAWLIFFKETLGKQSDYWEENYSFLSRTIIPAGGSSKIPLYLLFLAGKTKQKISTVAIPDTKKLSTNIKEIIDKNGLDPLTQKVFSFEEIVDEDKKVIKDIEDLFEPTEWLKIAKSVYEKENKKIEIPENFEFPKEEDLKDGIIKYMKKSLEIEDIMKIEISFEVYRKLVNINTSPFDEKTRKRFLKVFKDVGKKFNKSNE